MLKRELANGRNDVAADEDGRARDAERAPQRLRCVGELGLGKREFAKRGAHASVEGEARLGRLRRACGATDEDDSELRFERREGPADRLQRPAKANSSPGQVPGVNDRDEGLIVLELRAVGRELFHFTREYPPASPSLNLAGCSQRISSIT
jgi:hypothetical protein